MNRKLSLKLALENNNITGRWHHNWCDVDDIIIYTCSDEYYVYIPNNNFPSNNEIIVRDINSVIDIILTHLTKNKA